MATTSSLAGSHVTRDPIVREQRNFISHDGAAIAYRAWVPPGATKGVLLFHRGHEHSGRLRELVTDLGLLEQDVALFAWDARGHGLSPGERGWARDLGTIVKDVQSFADHIRATYRISTENLAVLAHSVGSVIAAAWVHDYAPPIRGMVLVAPAFRVKLYIPLARPALRLLQWWNGPDKKSFVKSYVRGKMLTHDLEQARAYDSDPLISRQIAVNILLDLHDISTRLIDDAGAITTPTLVMAAGKDWVVKNGAIRTFVARLGSPIKDFVTFPAMYHAVLNEVGRDKAIGQAKAFLQMALALEPRKETVLREQYTADEYERLCRPLSPLDSRAWNFALQRGFLKTLGRWSDGVALGWRCGFDSGESLDYIYENRPRGRFILGKLIDQGYLNASGWRGIRQRAVHIRAILDGLIAALHAEGKAIHILDVAAGPGRYLLETLAAHADQKPYATLRDFSPTAIAQGQALASRLGLQHITFEQGDAFDEEQLAALATRTAEAPRPDIAIVSGLYELFEDNDKIQVSLRGIFRALAPGGYLIYTNQPWHPQVEMIARVLINREGKPWTMRRRTQAEMDRLVRAAGFEKVDMKIDRWGIFTVSVAKRRGSNEGRT
jgi:alpha-beta hydrolase superfamily lysophospholipase/SAM-dependent methyltransferase